MIEFASDAVEPKHPDESAIYSMDWSRHLNSGATISTSSWTVDTGLTKVGEGIVSGNTKTSVQVSGGQPGTEYACTNTVVTSDGETKKRIGIVRVRAR